MSLSLFDRNERKKNEKLAQRWGGYHELVNSWVPISHYFLENYHRLKPHEGASGLNSTEAMLLIHLINFKWDSKSPHPSVTTLAERLGISPRQTRNIIKRLEDLGFLKRRLRRKGATNAFDMDGLFQKLVELQKQDIQANEEEGVS